ncbi:hypothetical protein BQ8482_40046 [Mesorhizobium delmotii]|uniref:Uncharacterized protein n=1 Tax=Mesorhizobium delmotii TaxID=1631247 RepID=A0A2P9AT11_9HYPH|nr:hypothetical protein BQ8482_40046 [Mesorhizobium delmotii]
MQAACLCLCRLCHHRTNRPVPANSADRPGRRACLPSRQTGGSSRCASIETTAMPLEESGDRKILSRELSGEGIDLRLALRGQGGKM